LNPNDPQVRTPALRPRLGGTNTEADLAGVLEQFGKYFWLLQLVK
jgi:hypothetical protein